MPWKPPVAVVVAAASSIAIAALTGAPVAAGRHGSALPCPPRGQYVIASDREVRVYRPVTHFGLFGPELPVVACTVRQRTRMTLIRAREPRARRFDPGSLGRIALAGHIVGYVVDRLTGVDSSSSALVVADVAHRRILRETATGYSVDGGFVFSASPTALTVASTGSVAWIVHRSRPSSSAFTTTVYAAPPTGPAVVLDESDGIDPAKLAIDGPLVRWTNAGVSRSAPLP